MDSAQWMQEIGVAKTMDSSTPRPGSMEQKKLVRPQKDQAVNCPRCNSTNTKFCYYNNYSLTQPRYFCKTCRRYWTEGGTLRNVPVGGGSRKNKKSTSSSQLPSTIHSHNNKLPDLNPPISISTLHHHQNPNKIHNDHHQHHHNQGLQDLNLGFQATPQDHHYNHQFLEFPKIFEGRDLLTNTSSPSSSTPLSALNLLRNEIAAKGFNPFIAMAPAGGNLETNAFFPSSNFQYSTQECKPLAPTNLANFSFEGISNNNNINGNINVFPFGGMMKRQSSTSEGGDDDDQGKGVHQQENSNGFWNGMLGGTSW